MRNLFDATKETTPFGIYKELVISRAGIFVAQADAHRARLHQAYDMGEAAWMIADELRLRCMAPKPHKTPRQLAVRVVRVA